MSSKPFPGALVLLAMTVAAGCAAPTSPETDDASEPSTVDRQAEAFTFVPIAPLLPNLVVSPEHSVFKGINGWTVRFKVTNAGAATGKLGAVHLIATTVDGKTASDDPIWGVYDGNKYLLGFADMPIAPGETKELSFVVPGSIWNPYSPTGLTPLAHATDWSLASYEVRLTVNENLPGYSTPESYYLDNVQTFFLDPD